MQTALAQLIDRLDNRVDQSTDVMMDGGPIPFFGYLPKARIATLGINPSDKEFIDNNGNELNGDKRRFHTLNSLQLSHWGEVRKKHLKSIENLCHEYFNRNPYDNWFKKLDYIISGTNSSYYTSLFPACHLDIVPYATKKKWGHLNSRQRSSLIDFASDTLGIILKKSHIKLLVLNGKTVVENLQRISSSQFDQKQMQDWFLPRSNTNNVPGFAFEGEIQEISNIKLSKAISVLGFNHNIQSSFGVSKQVKKSIQAWIGENANRILNAP